MTIVQRAAAPAENTLFFERRFDAPPAVVFRLWTKPELLALWWGPRDFTAHSVEMDFRPGGAWRAAVRSPLGDDYAMAGVYREIDEGKRLAFTLAKEGDRQETLVTVTFDGLNGTTRLGFRQTPIASQIELETRMETWRECFDRLESYLLREHWDNR